MAPMFLPRCFVPLEGVSQTTKHLVL